MFKCRILGRSFKTIPEASQARIKEIRDLRSLRVANENMIGKLSAENKELKAIIRNDIANLKRKLKVME